VQSGIKYNSLRTMNARVKLFLTLAFILTVSLTPGGAWPVYIFFLVFTFSLALVSHIKLSQLIKRSLLVLPFLFAAIPLIFWGPPPMENIQIIKGDLTIPISPSGVERFFSIVLKSWVAAQMAILFTSLTPMPEVLIAMRSMGVPQIFISTVSLMWHYLEVLKEEALRLLQARISRSTRVNETTPHRPGRNVFWRARVTGGLAGNLLLRGLEHSDRLYQAMLARGYNGNPPFYRSTPLNTHDRRTLWAGLSLYLLLLIMGILAEG